MRALLRHGVEDKMKKKMQAISVATVIAAGSAAAAKSPARSGALLLSASCQHL